MSLVWMPLTSKPLQVPGCRLPDEAGAQEILRNLQETCGDAFLEVTETS